MMIIFIITIMKLFDIVIWNYHRTMMIIFIIIVMNYLIYLYGYLKIRKSYYQKTMITFIITIMI